MCKHGEVLSTAMASVELVWWWPVELACI